MKTPGYVGPDNDPTRVRLWEFNIPSKGFLDVVRAALANGASEQPQPGPDEGWIMVYQAGSSWVDIRPHRALPLLNEKGIKGDDGQWYPSTVVADVRLVHSVEGWEGYEDSTPEEVVALHPNVTVRAARTGRVLSILTNVPYVHVAITEAPGEPHSSEFGRGEPTSA